MKQFQHSCYRGLLDELVSHLGLLPNLAGTADFSRFSLPLLDPHNNINDNGLIETLVIDVAKPFMLDICVNQQSGVTSS